MSKKYYKVMRGWGDDFISIELKDLQRAIYAQVTGGILIADGTIAGNKIEMIVPDYHKTLGYNYGYKLEPEDYNIAYNRFGDLQSFIGVAGEQVKYLIETKQEHLIGKQDFELPKKRDIDDDITLLANKFKI